MQENRDLACEVNLVPSSVNIESHTPQEIKAANYARSQALEYFKKSNFGRALAHLFVALRLLPEWRNELRSVFCQALNHGCNQLIDDGRIDEALSLKKDSLSLYPQDKVILMDLGSSYYQLDDIEQSLLYYKLALKASSGCLLAHRAIQSIYNKEVERWHFRMLNDTNRNRAYHRAIGHRIQEGYSSILDVGTGTGILSLYAVEKGAGCIWACESNTFMFNTAKNVLAVNNASDRVHLINKNSQQLLVPSDIPKKVSMIITEVFDAGLLGEGILPLLVHAWENLLLPPSSGISTNHGIKEDNGIVLPYSAKVWIAAIQSIDISRRHRLLPSACSCRRSDNDDESSSMERFYIDFGGVKYCKLCEASFDKVKPDNGNLSYYLDNIIVAADSSEPYTTEDLENIPHGYELLSKPYEVLEINFNNIEELRDYGYNRLKETDLSLVIDSAGSVDAIAAWFHLNLDNNGTIISTAPFSESGLYRGVCWHQAVFPFFLPRRVSPGDKISVTVDTWGNALKVSETGIDFWPKKVKDHMIFQPRSVFRPFSNPSLFVSDHIVVFLNNKTWMKALIATAFDLVQYFSHNPTSTKKILDMNPFPILGLQILKASDPAWKLTANAESKEDEEFIIAVARKNFINVEQIDFISSQNLKDKIEQENFDVINVNIVDSRGEFAENVTNLMPCFLSKLSKCGIVVPYSLCVECQMIESIKLLTDSCVLTEESMGNFRIKDHINTFAVDYHIDIASHGLTFKALSPVFELFKFKIHPLSTDNACYDQSQEMFVTSTGSGTVSGILYWFNILLRPGITVSTLCHDSHCNQAALLSSLNVQTGMKVLLKGYLLNGLLDIKIYKTEV